MIFWHLLRFFFNKIKDFILGKNRRKKTYKDLNNELMKFKNAKSEDELAKLLNEENKEQIASLAGIKLEDIKDVILLEMGNYSFQEFEKIKSDILSENYYRERKPFSYSANITHIYQVELMNGKIYAIAIGDPYEPFDDDFLIWRQELTSKLPLKQA